MSALVHCDGPGCDKTKSAAFEDRRLCDPDWMMLEASDRNYDFHSEECLARWVTGKPVAVKSPATIVNVSEPDPRPIDDSTGLPVVDGR